MMAVVIWQRPQLLWLTVLLLALATAGWLLFDRFTTRGLSPLKRCTLGLLRMIGLTVIVLSLLRPAVSLREPSAHRGTVAMLVDQSASMSVIDSSRNRAELVSLAAALGDVDASRRDQRLLRLGDAVAALRPLAEELSRAAGELDYAKLTQRSVELSAGRLRDTQASLAHRVEAAERAAGLASQAAVLKALQSIRIAAATTQPETLADSVNAISAAARAAQLQSDADLDAADPSVRGAVDRLRGCTRLELVQRCLRLALPRLDKQFTPRLFGFDRSLSTGASVDALAATQAGTDLTGAIRELRHRLTAERLSALIVCSDGRQTEALSGDALNTADLPIFTVRCAAETVADVAVQQITLPRSVFSGEPATATVTLAQMAAATQTVNLMLRGDSPAQSWPTRITGPTTRATLPFTGHTLGPLSLDAIVDPQAGESTLLNNSIRGWTRVSNTPLRAAVLFSNSTPDVRSLLASLQSDPSVSISLPPLSAAADLSDTFAEQDLVILCDVAYDRLGERSWWGLQRFIRDRGGAAILATASPSVFLSYGQHPATQPLLGWPPDQTPVLRLWPSTVPTFHPVAANGEATATLPLADDGEANRQAWREWPALFHVLNFPTLSATAQPLAVEAQSRSPLLAMQYLGFGRVLLLGSDELHRWKSSLLTVDHLWRRLVDRVSGGVFAVDDGVLGLDVDSLSPQPLQTLHVRTKVRAGTRYEADETFDPPLLLVERDGRRHYAQLLAAPSDPFPTRTDVTLPDLPAGAYRLTLLWADRRVALPLSVAESYSRELGNISGDAGTLAALAGPRGEALPLDALPQIAQRIEAITDPTPAVVTYPLWDSPYLFLLVIGCFCADWAIRQQVGLA